MVADSRMSARQFAREKGLNERSLQRRGRQAYQDQAPGMEFVAGSYIAPVSLWVTLAPPRRRGRRPQVSAK